MQVRFPPGAQRPMKILLTGDDGYNSIGIRLLCQSLHGNTLVIVGTKEQQTGMGGKISVREGGGFIETTVDGVPAIAVEGTPADAMEFARAYYKEDFDLLLSGVNLGDNVTSAIISSGTVSAVFRGMGLGIAHKAIAISWSTPPEFFFKPHSEEEDLTPYLEHPGKNISEILSHILNDPQLDVPCLNVNIPSNRTNRLRYTKVETEARRAYPPLHIDYASQRFSYPFVSLQRDDESIDTDIGALGHNEISITPILLDWTDHQQLQAWKGKENKV